MRTSDYRADVTEKLSCSPFSAEDQLPPIGSFIGRKVLLNSLPSSFYRGLYFFWLE